MENTQEVVAINPTEFGIDKNRAMEISNKFSPIQPEIDAFTQQYNALLTQEINADVAYDARALRLKLRDLRTKKINVVHKSEKEFFLAGGKFVDAWKNKLNTAIELMEERLTEIEKFEERREAERIEQFRKERWEEMSKYTSIEPKDLGTMDEFIYKATLNGLKAEYERQQEEDRKAEEIRLEAERKAEEERKEKERIEKLHNSRKEIALPYFNFWTEEEKQINFAEVSQEDFDAFINRLKIKQSEFEKQQEEQRAENERLKAEAEAREKQLEKERQEQAKKEAEAQKAKEAAEEKARQAQAEADRLRKEAEERAAKEAADRKAKEEAEVAEKKRLAEEAEKRKKAPIKNQLNNWVEEFKLPEIPVQNEVSKQIEEKFLGFQKWAKSEIEKL